MARAEYQETAAINRDRLWKAITDYAAYPQFVEHCKQTRVTREPGQTRARVDYFVEIMGQEVRYALELTEQAEQGRVDWKLLESPFFKVNSGGWEIRALGPESTQVRYYLELEFLVPVPGFVLNRLIKGSLPSMVKSFVERARKL